MGGEGCAKPEVTKGNASENVGADGWRSACPQSVIEGGASASTRQLGARNVDKFKDVTGIDVQVKDHSTVLGDTTTTEGLIQAAVDLAKAAWT
mgnify:CR=1 FL=1